MRDVAKNIAIGAVVIVLSPIWFPVLYVGFILWAAGSIARGLLGPVQRRTEP